MKIQNNNTRQYLVLVLLEWAWLVILTQALYQQQSLAHTPHTLMPVNMHKDCVNICPTWKNMELAR